MNLEKLERIIAYRLKNEETEEVKAECIARVKALTDKVTMYNGKTYIK